MALHLAAGRTGRESDSRGIRLLVALTVVGLLLVVWPCGALAQNGRAAPRTIELRASISPAAASFYPEARLRRLLQLELQNTAVLAASLAGPPADHVAWLWIDLPEKTMVRIEGRMASGLSARRMISIESLGTDPAARHIALAAAEMIRSLAQPSRVRKPPAGKPVCCEQAEQLLRSMPSLALSAGAGGTVITSESIALFGPWLGLGLRYHHAGVRLVGRWNGGWPAFGSLSWLETGVGADYRFVLHPSWRLRLGAVATAASLQLGGVSMVDGSRGLHSTWSSRAGASLGIEMRVGEGSWLSLSAEPGAILRPVEFADGDGAPHRLSGAWLGFDLALVVERRP